MRRTTPDGKERLLKKATHDAGLQRKKHVSLTDELEEVLLTGCTMQKADLMRHTINAFKSLYSDALTISIQSLCLTEWQSSEHSDIREATQDVWNMYHDKVCAGKNSLEVPRLEWWSQKVWRLHKYMVSNIRDTDMDGENLAELYLCQAATDGA